MILEIISLPFKLALGGVIHNFAINFFTLQVFKGKSILSGNEGQSPVVLVVLSVWDFINDITHASLAHVLHTNN